MATSLVSEISDVLSPALVSRIASALGLNQTGTQKGIVAATSRQSKLQGLSEKRLVHPEGRPMRACLANCKASRPAILTWENSPHRQSTTCTLR
jgi:hypothetical protein